MKEEYRQYCNDYYQRSKKYDAYMDDIVQWILAHPAATRKEIVHYISELSGSMNSGDYRMVADAHKIINALYRGVGQDYIDVHIDKLEDGDTSSLRWKEVNHKRMLVLSDIHFPYHDKAALMLALRVGKEKQVDSILLNGDILDFYQLSKFSKDFRKPSIKAELDVFRFFIDQLKQRFPEATIYYKFGNHEQRFERWIQNNAQMFDGILDIENLVDFEGHGVVFLKDNIGVKFGKLNIIHGHEIRAGMGVVNIARTYYMKAQSNLLFGHWHQNQEYITRTMDGAVHGAWAQGCLCKLDAEYTYGINQWVHGFSIVDRTSDEGDFRVKLYKILDGDTV
jgi:predicted phosphodiesterase